ncbi:MAG: chromate transporter [Clostridia bacterium]|nr:chromate transporter [Clostridia bacterium]
MIFLQLFFRFFCVGLFSVGGGLATLPFLTDMAETTGWFTQTDISNMIAISESTPGPIGINMATYVGYQTGYDFGAIGGVIGALVAPLGLTAPALIVIVIISRVLQKFRSSKYVEWVFYGLRAASLGLIASACLGVAKIAFFSADAFAQSGNFLMAVDYKSIILSVLVFFGISKFKKIHPIVFILIAAVAGVVFKF